MKYSKKYLYYSVTKMMLIMLFAFVVLVIPYIFFDNTEFESEAEEIVFKLFPYVLLGVFFLVILYIFISYYFISYEINDNELVQKNGIILRKTQLLTYENINAVNIHQGVFMHVFGISKISIDSGCSSKNKIDEIVIYEDSNKIKEIEELILRRMNKITSKESLEDTFENSINYNISLKDILFNTFSSVGLIAGLFGYILALIFLNVVTAGFEMCLLYNILFNIFVIIIFVINILEEYFRLYKFTIIDEGNSVRLKYGLFIKRDYAISKERVRAVVFKQDVVKKKYGYVNVCLEMIGLGNIDNQNDKVVNNLLIPFCEYDEGQKIVNRLFPEYESFEAESIAYTSRKDSGIFFVILPLIIEFICFIPLMVLFICLSKVLICLFLWIVISLLTIIIRISAKKNQEIKYDDKKTYIRTGSIFIRTYAIRWENVVCLKEYNTFAREKRSITSIKIDYYGGEKSIRMLMYDKENFSMLCDKLKKKASRKDKVCLD